MKRIYKSFGALLLSLLLVFGTACGGETSAGDSESSLIDSQIEPPDEWDEGRLPFDDLIRDTYQAKTGLVNPPTVVTEVRNQADLDALNEGERLPSNVILRFNQSYNIVDADGKKLDSFANIYRNILQDKIIPILYIKTAEEADACAEFFSERMDFFDLAVMSDTPELVKSVRLRNKRIRGIVEYTDLEDIYNAVAVTNANLANVAVLSEELATVENVRFVQARLKTVWVKISGETKSDYFNGINSGAYGIVAHDFEEAYDVLEGYTEGITRMPFNVAHRGLPLSNHENSVSGTLASVEAGATHVELDGYLTTDRRIVMMHDADIEATTNGKGAIESMSLSELRQYKLDKFRPLEDVPTLEEIIEVLEDTDVVLVFEIKSTNPAFIEELKKILDNKDFYRQIVVISFYDSVISEMLTVLPEVPTAYLGEAKQENFTMNLTKLNMMNAGVDTIFTNFTREFNEKYLRDRGLVGWFWTYGTLEQNVSAATEGIVGITTNVADRFARVGNFESIMYIEGCKTYSPAAAVQVGDGVKVTVTSYTGDSWTETGSVFAVEEQEDCFAVVASYKDTSNTLLYTPRLYTKTFYIEKR